MLQPIFQHFIASFWTMVSAFAFNLITSKIKLYKFIVRLQFAVYFGDSWDTTLKNSQFRLIFGQSFIFSGCRFLGLHLIQIEAQAMRTDGDDADVFAVLGNTWRLVFLEYQIINLQQFIIYQMELIQAHKQVKINNNNQLLFSRIKRVLQSLTTHLTLTKIQPNAALFVLLLKEKKNTQTKLWTHWNLTLSHSLSLQISLTDPHKNFVLPDPSIITTDVLQKLNRESIFGTYFTQEEQGLISFRHTLATQNHKFLGAAFSQIFWQVSQQFAKWTHKLKLVPQQDKHKSSKIHHCLKRIRYTKEFFQNQRLNKPKSLKVYDLTYSSIKVVEEAMRVISYHTALLKNHRNNQLKKNQSLLQLYKSQYESVLKEMAVKQNEEVPNCIMRGIEIDRVIDQKKIDEGGFSQIYRGEYIVGVISTISSKQFPKQPLPSQSITMMPLNPIPKDNSEFESQLSRKLLAKKVLKSSIKEDDSFKNEINLLKFIRNQKDPRIAGYYMPSQQEKLYMEYYQHNLLVASQNWTQKQLLTTVRQIAEGITFLANRDILHRDLKELNVLIDSHNCAKIIDFGSSCAIYKEQPKPGDYQAINNALMSTKNYYFPYSDIEREYPSIKKNFTRDQYNRAQTFDVFSIGNIIRNLFSLDRCFDNIFYRQLYYLAEKCQERNPEDRLTSKQLETYLYLLSQLYRLENEENQKLTLKSMNQTKEGSLPNDFFDAE